MTKEIKTKFVRKLIYRQKDRAQIEVGNFEAVSSMWAVAWSYEGLEHPITSRIRVNIVHDVDSHKFDPCTAGFEIWREHEWKIIDACFQGYTDYESIGNIEDECLYMAEAFLMGENIDEVRAKYGVEADSKDIDSNESNEEEETPNVLKLFPNKD